MGRIDSTSLPRYFQKRFNLIQFFHPVKVSPDIRAPIRSNFSFSSVFSFFPFFFSFSKRTEFLIPNHETSNFLDSQYFQKQCSFHFPRRQSFWIPSKLFRLRVRLRVWLLNGCHHRSWSFDDPLEANIFISLHPPPPPSTVYTRSTD